jgi:hypothetical protein
MISCDICDKEIYERYLSPHDHFSATRADEQTSHTPVHLPNWSNTYVIARVIFRDTTQYGKTRDVCGRCFQDQIAPTIQLPTNAEVPVADV